MIEYNKELLEDRRMNKIEENREELIEKLNLLVKKKLPAQEFKLISKFIPQYYATVALEDLKTHDIVDLYGAVLSHWALFSTRKNHELKFRIYNPQFEEHGWQSPHTVIEVVQDDMPFLVDSIQMELNRCGLTTHLLTHLGGMRVLRNEKHQVIDILPPSAQHVDNYFSEAVIFIEIDRQTDPKKLKNLEKQILSILDDVRVAVEDWKLLLDKLEECILEIENNPPPVSAEELEETIDFLRWIKNDHFTFIGYREYEVPSTDSDERLYAAQDIGYGIYRPEIMAKKGITTVSITPEARRLTISPETILLIAKTNTKSTLHRPAYTDLIGIKVFDKNGKVIGEKCFVGLYTSAAYNRNPRDIPLLRRKVAKVLEDSGLSMKGHAGKALVNILENFPRDDLFQTSTKELLDMAMGILHLHERRVTRLFIRKDLYGRYMSCLVFVPRDRYDTELRQKMENILIEAFHGTESSFATYFSESVLARIHYMIRINPETPLQFDEKELQRKIIDVGRQWHDYLRAYLRENNGEEKANELIDKYLNGFPAGYIENTNPRTAVFDLEHIEKLNNNHQLEMSLFRPIDEAPGTIRFKLFTLNEPIPLSNVLPILENMGLRVMSEQPYRININNNDNGTSNGNCARISDFSMELRTKGSLLVDSVKQIFQTAFEKIWFGEAENDGFNRLVLQANLNWREVALLRAYAKYFRQIGFTFSQNYIEDVLSRHPSIVEELVKLFHLRFDPDLQGHEKKIEKIEKKLHDKLEAVESLDEDRILRHFYICIFATLRVNFYQYSKNKLSKNYLSFKLDPEKIPDMPLPKPLYEVFVYSPQVEGVHLRSHKVARGGLRHSDRREDFRTEVLGLMKAQKVKNAVIVPSGAKGGFVIKKTTEEINEMTREEYAAETVKCYQTFIKGLLDLTDNIKDSVIVHPSRVIFYDDNDPYLVVAADKGTATFSNYANQISAEYDFWLGDAFASGGITGYDHKKMGITARGAWESVKRHFADIGMNIQKNNFTVIGIGDLAGDVFGNGMLLSEHIQLVAAFNHMHIFIDPNPCPQVSFEERKRLFNLPRSTWEDYNEQLLSKGGGIFKRSAKAIKLSPEIMQLLHLKKSIVVPHELIRAILMAPVDLLFNGGIGTFVKASDEDNLDAGDKTNDSIRINGNDLCCKVVGEGGNLGFTQLGRVEYALTGGKIYTDFIDNSAGVDCSDHEVNIKILLNQIVANGDMTEKQRNQLLADMTDEIAELVIKNNYWQTRAIDIAIFASQGLKNIDLFQRLMQDLETRAKLDRQIEFLPDDKALLERKSLGLGLTAPEMSILLAYSKSQLKEDILASDLPEDSYISTIIETAFPRTLNKKFKEQIKQHSLRREIIATQLSNAIINDMGMSFVHRINDETGASVSGIVRAYSIARSVFRMKDFFNMIEALDNVIDSEVQIEMIISVGRLIRRGTRWFLSYYRDLSNIHSIIDQYEEGIAKFSQNLPDLMTGSQKESYENDLKKYLAIGVPQETAQFVASSTIMFSALDIIAASNEHGFDVENVAKVYFTLGASLDLFWFREQIVNQSIENHWQSLARAAFRDDIDWQQRELTVAVLQHEPLSKNAEECIEIWSIAHKPLVDRWNRIVSDLRSSQNKEFVMFSVAIRGLLDLTQACMQTVKQLKKIEEHEQIKH